MRLICSCCLHDTLLIGPTVGRQRALTLVNPVSKVILQEAVRADCDFLASSNIMDYSYERLYHLLLRSLTREFPGCCSVSTGRGSRFTVAWWTLSAATRSQRLLSTRQRAFLGKTGRTSPLSHRTSTRNVSCPHWMAIFWHAQVRMLMCDDHQIDRFVSDKWT